MKIIHTADWHLGQNFYDYDRLTEHGRFLTWLKKTVREYRADILLIAGDVFDSPNPSAESQKMYFAFLREITNENPHLQIIIIAGNHDSAARLEAPNPLLEEMNITVRGLVRRNADGAIDYERLIIPLDKGGYCLAVPYLRQGDCLTPSTGENYSKSVKALYDKLYETTRAKMNPAHRVSTTTKPVDHDPFPGRHFDTTTPEERDRFPCRLFDAATPAEAAASPASGDRPEPIIALGHLQATGSEISENDRSERTIIGGLECVSPDAFDCGIAYTALGHLHRGQRVSGRENIRYSGAPLPMSFAEKNNRQGVVFVEIKDRDTHIEHIVYEDAVRLLSIPSKACPLDEVLREIAGLPEGEITAASPFLEIKVRVTEPEPSMRHRIEEALKGKAVRLARISAVTLREDGPEQKENKTATLEELQTASPVDIAEKKFGEQYGGEKMPAPMRKLLLEVIREVEQ
jgi:exonuclease SbcD